MKKFFKKLAETIGNGIRAIGRKVAAGFAPLQKKLAECTGEGYVDSAIKIIIALVVGALLLGGLYALFKTTVLPTMTEKITEMFSYSGT